MPPEACYLSGADGTLVCLNLPQKFGLSLFREIPQSERPLPFSGQTSAQVAAVRLIGKILSNHSILFATSALQNN
jgi:hypothetical protein